MKKKRLIGTLLASSIALSATLTGCSLVTANSNADMRQVIASVNISSAENLSEQDSKLIENFKDAVGTTEIYKSELIAYYLNVGVSYVNSGYPYSTVFNMLVDGLVQNAVLTQYAVMYLLNDKAGTGLATTVLNEYTAKDTYVEKLEYLLTDSTAEDPEKDIKIAQYGLYSSINAALDSYERQWLDEEDSTSGSGSRTTPSGVNTEVDDYYPATEDGSLDYNVYTGYDGYLLADSGVYKEDALEGSNKLTRTRAYNSFISTLVTNGLIDPSEDLLKVTEISYMQKEYASQLENRVINKYYDLYEKEQEAKLTDEGRYDYLDTVYNSVLDDQEYLAENSFTSTMDNISDTSFGLYSPDTEDGGTYGYVYNILLPFSTVQSAKLSSYQSTYADTENGGYKVGYYNERNKLMQQITTTDQRSAWFNGSTDYSFNAAETDLDYYKGSNDREYDREYLFFENNLTKEQYEPLDKYIGKYPYNGRVYEMEDGSYQLLPEKLDIDGMLDEFKAYIEYVLGGEGSVTVDKTADYYEPFGDAKSLYTDETKDNEKVADREIDYAKFIYASGKVELSQEVSDQVYKANLLNKDSLQYKALAAVNELQYAYTTDTSVLSQYLGYSVTLGDTTGYIKEFEAAAQAAIEKGAGAFTVCAGNYGWHLIYVTYTFNPEGGAEYAPDWQNNVDVEGTFENMFYEWVKNNAIAEISSTRRTQIMTQFNKDNTVCKYQSTYQDLLDLDS